MNLALLLDLYELTMGESYFAYKSNTLATFDLLVRYLPENRSYLVACGLEDILNHVSNLKFNSDDLAYLKKQKLFSEKFLNYLKHFRFKGDIWAMPEGAIFFPQEPVLRITANIIEAQILESFFLNTINLQAMVASKASRIVSVAGESTVYDFALRRTHGAHAGIKVARSAYLAGFAGTSNVLAGKLYNIPIAGTMAHSYVMSFKKEIESFLAYVTIFPDKAILLVDTYDIKKGIENAVKVGLYLKAQKHKLLGIRLDSGDITGLSKLARKMLDRAGLSYVKIFASGNLDEFKIKALIKKGARVDSFGVGTSMGTSIDAPNLDVIYKLSEVTDDAGNFLPTMKISKDKVTYPGRKQVFRVRNKEGKFIRDILGLEKEDVLGEPLLKKVVAQGKYIYKTPFLDKIRAYAKDNLSRFPKALKEIDTQYKYPVVISPKLKKLKRDLFYRLEERQ